MSFVLRFVVVSMETSFVSRFVVVSMETEHNFEHNTYITVA